MPGCRDEGVCDPLPERPANLGSITEKWFKAPGSCPNSIQQMKKHFIQGKKKNLHKNSPSLRSSASRHPGSAGQKVPSGRVWLRRWGPASPQLWATAHRFSPVWIGPQHRVKDAKCLADCGGGRGPLPSPSLHSRNRGLTPEQRRGVLGSNCSSPA